MKRMSRVVCTLAALLMSLGSVQTASAGAGLAAFSPNPARLDGVITGGMPAWYQDQSGVAVDACFDVINCGLVGFLPNNALPLAYPTNFPEEAFYFLSQADISMTGGIPAGGASASIIMALEYTFVNPVSGALTGPVATPNALSAPFQRIRIIETLPFGGGNPGFPVGGNFTLSLPGGETLTIPAADAKCVNQGGNTKCTFTQDVPGPGAIPPNFVAAQAAGVPGSINNFIKSTVPPPPAGFLGNGGATISAVTTAGAPAIFTLTDPLGNTGNNGPGGSFSTLVGKITGLDVQPGNTHNFGGVIMPATSVVHTVTVTNTTGTPILFPALVTAGADAADFTIAASAAVGAAPFCSGATVANGVPAVPGGAAAIPAGSCSFDITFTPTAVTLPTHAARVATIAVAPTSTVVGADNPPPVTISLTGTAQIKITTALATPHGTITPDATAVPVVGTPGAFAAPAGSPVTFTVTPTNKKFKVKEITDVVGAAAAVPVAAPFTIDTAAADHTVTATFMQSGDLDADGFLNVNDALKALRIVAGIQQADVDDPDNTAVKVAPLTNGLPAALNAKVNPDIGDVLVILRRALNLETW